MAPTFDPFGYRKSSASPPPAEIRAELERILGTATFEASPRRRLFLRYLVEESLAGHAGGLKEYSVALAVFGRDGSFESQSDPVVRLEARRLRRDLNSYYVDAGARDTVRITIPKGGYVPHFKWHQTPAEAAPSDDTSDAGGSTIVGATGAAPAADEADSAGMAGRGPRSVRISAGLLVVALLATAVGLWLWFRGPSPPDEEARLPAIIVLPFDALSDGEDDHVVASGVSQELITNLMRFDSFRLYSLPASFRQDANANPMDMGRNLGVAYVVKGSVLSDLDKIRVGAQLFNAQTGQVLWSETYDRARTPKHLIGLQSELAASIASVLGQPYGVVNRDLSARLSKGILQSMLSYACVLRAHEYRRSFRDELRRPVLACLEAAVRRDPDYSDAWALLGWLHLDAARYAFVPDSEVPREMNQALEMASRAVALDSSNEVALRALSAVNFHLENFAESERIQRRALALNPNDPDTLAQLGWRLAMRGRWDEGLDYLERAIARTIDPPAWYYDTITIHLYLEGKYSEMLALAKRSGLGDPTSMALIAIAQGALGNREAAHEALVKMAEISPAMGSDPESVYRRFHPTEDLLNALMDGLRKAGWTKPGAPAAAVEGRP